MKQELDSAVSLGDASGDEEQRRLRVVQLGDDRGADAIDELVRALGDSSWRVRKAAQDALLKHHPRTGLVAALVRALAAEDNAGLRNASAETLVRIGAEALPELVTVLGSKDVDWQKFAIDVLGEIGAAGAVEPLKSTLDDPDENVRAAAAEALGKIGSLEAIDALWKRALFGTDLLVRLSALEALAKLDAPGPYEQLAELTKNRFLAKPAFALLGACPDPRAIEALVDAVAENPRSQRAVALLALDKRLRQNVGGEKELVREALQQRKPAALAALGELLHASDLEVVRAGIRALGQSGDPQAARLILDALSDESLVEVATSALSDLGPDATQEIALGLQHASGEARELAASMLAERGDARAIRMLVEGILDGERRMRDVAASMLMKVANTKVVAEVLEALPRADEDALMLLEEVLRAATQAKKQEARPLLAHKLGVPELGARQTAAVWAAFAYIVTEDDLPMLMSALRDERDIVRAAAVLGLAQLQSAEARRALLLCLSDESARVRKAVASHLASFSGDTVRDALIVAARDEDVEVASTAAAGLSRFDDTTALEALSALVQSERAQVAIAAISALATVAPDELQGWLSYLLSHRDVEVVKETVRVVLSKSASAATTYADRLLSHPQWDVRYVAVTTLGRFDNLRSLMQARHATEADELVRGALDEVLKRDEGAR